MALVPNQGSLTIYRLVRRRPEAFDVVRVIVGAILLVAAAAKGQGLVSTPSRTVGILTSRPLLVALVECEFLLGVVLVGGFWKHAARRAALGLFLCFAATAAYLAWHGEGSCGCFGRVGLNPRYTLIIDLVVITALLAIRPVSAPKSDQAWPRGRGKAVILAGIALTGIAAGLLMLREPALVAQDQAAGMTASGSLVILEPEKWVGKAFVLQRYIKDGGQLGVGRWKVVLYHSDCSVCQQTVPTVEAMARQDSTALSQRVALIEMPPYAASGRGLASPDSPCLVGQLSDEKDWFVHAPVILTLDAGRVTSAISEEHD